MTMQRPDQGLLTIFRPKVLGGKLEIRLRHKVSSLASISEKEEHRRQLKIRYGPWRQSVTLRAPTSAIFETWWAALESAFALPNFVAVPIVDARAHQVIIAPVLPARRNATRSRQLAALETVTGVEREDTSIDDIPMLEAKGPSSPTEIDILASWRTWGSQDHFTTPPSITSPLARTDIPQNVSDNNLASYDNDNGDKTSLYSDISEFWSRPSEWEDNAPPVNSNPVVNETIHGPLKSEVPHNLASQDDEAWLDEIARYAFRQKVGAQLHPLLRYAMS